MEVELSIAGLLGEGVYDPATQAVKTIQEHPNLLKLSLFTLERINLKGFKGPSSSRSPGSPALGDVSRMLSNFSALTFASNTTTVPQYGPDKYERLSYYNCITRGDDHPEPAYRSTPFPIGRHAYIPVELLRGVPETSLNSVWGTIGPQVRDLIKAREIHWSSADPARFFTHRQLGEKAKGSLGPVVIWIGVSPGPTSSSIAHEVSQDILALLSKNGVKDVVVEWRKAFPQKLAGPPLLRHVGGTNATHHVRRHLTTLLGVPLATEETEDAQGTLTLWFHENKDKHGRPSDKVYGVSNCHILRKNTTVEYEHGGGAPMDHVRVCGMRRLQRGLEEIMKATADHGILADLWRQEIAELQTNEIQDTENAREIRRTRSKLDDGIEAIAELEGLYDEVMRDWTNIKPQRNTGYVQYAATITADKGSTGYTSDWAAFSATKARVKPQFEGSVIDLGYKYSPQGLTNMFYPVGGGPTTFKFPEGRKPRIEGCVTKDDLAHLAEFDRDGQRCLIVGKGGNNTSPSDNEAGIGSVELGIYNSGVKTVKVFSAKGDSGSLVWHTTNGKARIVDQLHSGISEGGSTNNYATYRTPGW